MNADQLLKHFDRVADAPDAIPRLRRFILDLAVRGKLATPHSGDEHASQLIARLAEEKAALVNAGRFREPTSVVGIDRQALPFTPPDHWVWVRLIDIAKVSYGYAFASDKFNSEKRGMPLIRIRDISRTDTEAYFDGDFDRFYIVKAGDYMVGMDGDFNIRCWKGPEALLNQRVMRINNWRRGADPEFVKLPLQYILRHLHGSTSLTTVKHLSAKQVNGIEIPIPPLAEQHRIVAKVDELMALCDRLEAARTTREAARDRLSAASLARLNTPDPETFQADARFALDALPALATRPDQIKQFRRAILNLAVRGKLLTQNPKDEPASALLERIALEKARRVREGTLREQKPLPPIGYEEVEFEIAQGWKFTRMAEVIKLWNGFAFKSGDFQSTGVPVIRIGDLQDGEVKLSRAAYVSEAVAETVGSEVWVPPNALLIAMSGATTGKTAFNRTGTRLLLNQPVGRIEVFLMSVEFLRFFFETIIARNLSISFGTAIPNLSTQQINETVVPLPPLMEQHRIVAKVDKLMALCDRLEESLAGLEIHRSRLLNALLMEALAPVEFDEAA
jgi:type I restriction enzyme S subunit